MQLPHVSSSVCRRRTCCSSPVSQALTVQPCRNVQRSSPFNLTCGFLSCLSPRSNRQASYQPATQAAKSHLAAASSSRPTKSALARMPKDNVVTIMEARRMSQTGGNKQMLIDRLLTSYEEEDANTESGLNNSDIGPNSAVEPTDPPTYDDLMALTKDDLTKQCAAVGLPKSKRTKDQLANSLLSAMDSDLAAAEAAFSPEALLIKPKPSIQAETYSGVEEEVDIADLHQGRAPEFDVLAYAPSYDDLMICTKKQLQEHCESAGLPKSHRTKAEMAESLNAYWSAPERALLMGEEATERLVASPDTEEPSGELGLDLPELNPTSARSAVADNAADTDTDIVAQQRRTDKQPADLANQEDDDSDMDDVRMDDVLMLDQEPNPEYDVDEEQRPRISMNAEGQLTEANFGNDDETMGRLQDMGTPGGGLAEADIVRQNQGSAQRRRQAGRLAAADIPEDEDDEFGSAATEATTPGDSDGEAEEELTGAADDEELPIVTARGYGAESFDGFEEPDGSEAYLNNADLADGFQTSGSSADGSALDEEDAEVASDGEGMTNEQYGKVRKNTRLAQQELRLESDTKDDALPVPPVPKPDAKPKKSKQARSPKKAAALALEQPDLPSSSSDNNIPEVATAEQLDDPQDLLGDGAEFASLPDWLASKYNTAAKVSTPSQPPTTHPSGNPTNRPSSRIAAAAFKPTRKRKPAAQLMTQPTAAELESDAQSYAASSLGQTQPSDSSLEAELGLGEGLTMADEEMAKQDLLIAAASEDPMAAAAALDAALKSDTMMTEAAADEAADSLSPEATAAMATMLSSEADPSLPPSPSTDPYSVLQPAAAMGYNPELTGAVESGDLSPEDVNRDPSLTPAADAVINSGVASAVASDYLGMPRAEQSVSRAAPGASDDWDLLEDMEESMFGTADLGQGELTDAEISSESFAGALEEAKPSTQQGFIADRLVGPSATTDSGFESRAGDVSSEEGLLENLAASKAVMGDDLQAAQGSKLKAAEGQPQATSFPASHGLTPASHVSTPASPAVEGQTKATSSEASAGSQAPSAQTTGSTVSDGAQHTLPDFDFHDQADVGDAQATSQADVADASATAAGELTSSNASGGAQQGSDANAGLYFNSSGLSDAAAEDIAAAEAAAAVVDEAAGSESHLSAAESAISEADLAVAAEEAASSAPLPEAGEKPAADSSSTTSLGLHDLTNAGFADSSHVSPPSSVPDSGVLLDEELSDAAAEDLAAAAQEAASSPPLPEADEASASSSTAGPGPLNFLNTDPADSGSISPPSSIPESGLLPEEELSDAAAEDLAAAAQEAAVSAEASDAAQSQLKSAAYSDQSQLSSSSSSSNASQLQTDAHPESLALSSNSSDSVMPQTDSQPEPQKLSSSHALPPLELRRELASDLSQLQAIRSQVADKQAALAALESQLGSTNASAAQNRDQIQRLQIQMTELQDQHVAWQQTMLDGRLQELRTAAARVENNQAFKVDLQQQVQGMGDQLTSLEASLKASDKQASSLQQELASFGNTGPQPMKINGKDLNGASTSSLPKGYYYRLADMPPAVEASQEAALTPENGDSTELLARTQADSNSSVGLSSVPDSDVGDVTSEGYNANSGSQSSGQAQGQDVDGIALSGQSSGMEGKQSSVSSDTRAIQPGVAVTLGVLKAAEVGRATISFFTGLGSSKSAPQKE